MRIVFVALGLAATTPGLGVAQRSTGEVMAEMGTYTGQLQNPSTQREIGVAARTRITWESADRRHRLTVEPFLRWDILNGDRTRFDVRDLSWQMTTGIWEVTVGVREIFWGVAESQHLIDEINQRNPIGGVRLYEKLGQPLAMVAATLDWGTVELLALPIFRPRPFDGRSGRLWSPRPVLARDAVVRGGSRRVHADWALRYSHSVGPWDVGAAFFSGTARDPYFAPSGDSAWIPHHDLIDRTSVELLWTTGFWLFKGEGATQGSALRRFGSAVGGVEFAPVDFFAGILEYSYDSRGSAATTSYENDVFLGGRLLTEDGSVRAGAFVDTRSGAVLASVEASRRLGTRIVVTLEARAFLGDEARQPQHAFRQDTFVGLLATYHW